VTFEFPKLNRRKSIPPPSKRLTTFSLEGFVTTVFKRGAKIITGGTQEGLPEMASDQ
jgi:hypothetical protein